jgi:hypothetical protein
VNMTHTQQGKQGPVTLGELCEAIASGRVSAEVRDGHYEVTAVEIRGMRRTPEVLMSMLEDLREHTALLDPSGFEDIRPCGEDISEAI